MLKAFAFDSNKKIRINSKEKIHSVIGMDVEFIIFITLIYDDMI